MPFITDTAMQKVATKLQSFETREEKRKIEVRQKLNEAKTVAESSLGAALVGFMHGRFEDADANFFIPRTSIPAYPSDDRRHCVHAGGGTQFWGRSASTSLAGVESSRVRTSVRYAMGSTSFATQVATTV
jgi:hypothetical protein